MRFNRKNAETIKQAKFSLHDARLDSFTFDHILRSLTIEVLWPFETEMAKIVFTGVIGFCMTCCDFWGKSERISCFCPVRDDDRRLVSDLFQIKNSTENEYSSLRAEEEYLEMIIEFISGDSMRIACEYVDFETVKFTEN